MSKRQIRYEVVPQPRSLSFYEWAIVNGETVKEAFLKGKESHPFLKEVKRYHIAISNRDKSRTEEQAIETMQKIRVIELPKSYVSVIVLEPNKFLFFTTLVNPYRVALQEVISEYQKLKEIPAPLIERAINLLQGGL
jgi:hypothetical protein